MPDWPLWVLIPAMLAVLLLVAALVWFCLLGAVWAIAALRARWRGIREQVLYEQRLSSGCRMRLLLRIQTLRGLRGIERRSLWIHLKAGRKQRRLAAFLLRGEPRHFAPGEMPAWHFIGPKRDTDAVQLAVAAFGTSREAARLLACFAPEIAAALRRRREKAPLALDPPSCEFPGGELPITVWDAPGAALERAEFGVRSRLRFEVRADGVVLCRWAIAPFAHFGPEFATPMEFAEPVATLSCAGEHRRELDFAPGPALSRNREWLLERLLEARDERGRSFSERYRLPAGEEHAAKG